MAFGRRIRPPELLASEPVALAVKQTAAREPREADAAPKASNSPSREKIHEAALEMKTVLLEAFRDPADEDDKFVHLNSVIATAAAVLGQMAARKVYPDRTLDCMRPELPPGAVDGPVFADVASGEPTLFQIMTRPARNRLAAERLPNPDVVAQRLLATEGLMVPTDHLPYVNPLKVMAHYDAIALTICRRDGLDRKSAMLMLASCVEMLLQGEKDDEALAMRIRLALEVTLRAGRVNPRKRD